ncbi:unnamed protein product [Acanthoscelides obtectus]|uniref:Uncharacterized protein n=1 Tax=Acanthoscelides obtectus TaxID=200917 RepID=A0A9P0P9K4_ACAOB|nr:unnamed protein product [Acanthoscelides obtectus]CAK1655795.1 hypothetical protein AOBTE_LOCUS19342 [Acanthoscelides obtectus]
MNASLLKEKHHDRRGSKVSRGPSRQPSMGSLRPNSPNSQGSRGSRASSNGSIPSTTRSAKSPPQNINSATTPMLESVTVEIQQVKDIRGDVSA